MKFLKRILPDFVVERRYIRAGSDFGDMVSYIYFGESEGFEQQLDKWEKWEKEYVSRGYRTISLDEFVELGGYGIPLDKNRLGQRRKEGEEPVFHANFYREHFLGRMKTVMDMEKLQRGEKQIGNYVSPSTKFLEEKDGI